ncbi:ankyrin repeat-containing domain protein [Xylaria scruposa]|nr:ankyrin repeat-containing domain protein [Xylaria scruposa]
MDPLSISASVAGLVTLAGTVFSLVAKYIKDVRDAPKEARDLLDEVKQFSVLLHHLSLVARELEITTKTGEEALRDSPNLQWHHIYDCQRILNHVENRLTRNTEGLKSSTTLTKIRSRLKWPLSSDDTKDMIQTIQRHKLTINLALSATSYSRLAICLSRQEAADKRQEKTEKDISSIQDTVERILEIDTKVSLDRERTEVLNAFVKFADPWHDFEMVQSLRHPLTGLWFTESDDFKEWRATPGSKLWITGIPGAGKSVLAGLIVRECLKLSSVDDRKATAYFFCTYRNKATHSARNLLSSLVSQLARQKEEAFLVLEKYHQEIDSQEPVAAEPSLRELLPVFKNMCRLFDQVFVVVDGLDECDTDEVVYNLSQLLLKTNSTSISLLLLSRDVVLIRDRLESDFSHVEIEAHKEDIQLYVFTELERRIESKQLRLRNLELKTEIVDRLVHGAKGMFRWVACQLDYLGELPSDRERRNALSKLPPTLPATYERILMKVEQSSIEVRRLVQKTLLLISASLNNVDYLREALSIRDDSKTLTEEDMVDEYEIMLRCSSLIRKSTDGKQLEFSHFTVQEFLEGIDPTHATLHFYRISYSSAQNLLAQVCLQYLMLEDFEKKPRADVQQIEYIRKRVQTRPFYRHCTIGWIKCVRNLAEDDTEIDAITMELIQTLFESQKRASFCQWVSEYVDSWASERSTFFGISSTLRVELLEMLQFDFGRNTLRRLNGTKPYAGETQAFVKFMAAIFRPDFTPLHMASVLGLPSLCNHLLSQEAQVNLRSRFGTPLHCALGGMTVFLRRSTLVSRQILGSHMETQRIPVAQSQTVRLLLAAGANATPRLSTPFYQMTLMGTMHLSPVGFDTFELFPDLVKAGLIVEEEDLNLMESRLKYRDDIGFRIGTVHHGSIIVSLLESLKGIDDQSDTTITRLSSILYQHALNENLNLSALVPENVNEEFFSCGDWLVILKSIIVNNDVTSLENMVDGNRHEFLKNARFKVNDEEWTAIHLACNSSSADVLKLMLRIGIDPEIATHRGTKPIHLSSAGEDGGDALRVLLQHHVSTKATNDSLTTIWHLTIQNGDTGALKLLVELASDKDEALQIVSNSGQTPICLALDKKNEDAVKLLLQHCPTAPFWESNMPLYRQAAQLGSSKVVKKLLDMGIPLDDFDDELGSPLHDINLNAAVPCLGLLIDIFPHRHRQRNDGQIPIQSCLARAVERDEEIRPQILEALLPTTEASQPKEIDEQLVTMWSFFSSIVIKYIPMVKGEINWITKMLTHLIDRGLMSRFEEKHEISALVSFATELERASSDLLPRWLAIRQGQLEDNNDSKLPLLKNWACLSQMLLELASKTAFSSSAAEHESVTRLLSHAILHDDRNLVKRLLESGVDVHRRVDSLSALEIACVPVVAVSEDTFRCLLSHSKLDRLNEHNDRVYGYSIIHFIGLRSPFRKRAVWKLEQVLKAGANANAISYNFMQQPALIWHILGDNARTAEVLLQFGADPWLTNVDGFNAALAAIVSNNTSLLKTIEEHSVSRKLTPIWNQTWKDTDLRIAGANAFHLAAIHGSMNCMQIYLHEKWLDDLESVDDDLMTPMHYAALHGQPSIIRFLHNRGCDINRTARDGKSPLHQAASDGRLDAVKELLRLGAEIKVDANGLSPLVYAYKTGNSDVINALEGRNENHQNITSQLSPKAMVLIADAFHVALENDDLDACKGFVDQGLPIDSEMCDPWPVTPLMLALCEGMPSEVVEWLLEEGAKVSIIFEGPEMPQYATALEAAVADPYYNHLLPTILRRYSNEGGNFHLEQTPLHVAIQNANYEGLRVLLDEMRQTCYDIEHIVNQKSLLDGGAALHEATIMNSVVAATILISNGANIELADFEGFTPLHSAAASGSIDVLKELVKQGAYTEPLTHNKQTPLMIACSKGHVEVAEYLLQLKQTITKDSFGMDIVDPTVPMRDESSKLKLCAILFPRGFDLHRVNIFGLNLIIDAMARPKHLVLRYLLGNHQLSLEIRKIQWSSPFVHFCVTSNRFCLGNITRGYRLIHQYLGREGPLVVSESVAVGKLSLLYLAASRGLVAAVDDLLSIGIDIESNISEEGSPLTVAAAHGQLNVVKYLVRRGAQILLRTNGLQDASYEKKEVLQWLLVYRHTDQAKILNTDPNTDKGAEIRDWAGIIQVRLSLKWEWKKRRTETMLEYAFRFRKILKSLRGEVVKPIVEGNEDEWSNKDVDEQVAIIYLTNLRTRTHKGSGRAPLGPKTNPTRNNKYLLPTPSTESMTSDED